MKKSLFGLMAGCAFLFFVTKFAFAELVSGKVKFVNFNNGTITIEQESPDAESLPGTHKKIPAKTNKTSTTIGINQHTTFAGFKKLRELKLGRKVDIEIYGDEETGKPLAREIVVNVENLSSKKE